MRDPVGGERALERDRHSSAVVSTDREGARAASARRRLGRLPGEIDRLERRISEQEARIRDLEEALARFTA